MLAALEEEPAEPADERPANPLESLAGGVFVGRERSSSGSARPWTAALAGRGSLQLLVGEPGIGKTRAAEELATYARVSGARVYWGRCREDEGAPAYWPWVQAIRAYARDADPVALAWQLGAGAAEVAQLIPEVAEKLDIEPAKGSRQRGGPLPALRLGHQPAARRRPRPRHRDRARRPALGRRALAAPAPLRGPGARLERPADPRHLPRRRARPPPSAGPGAGGDVRHRGQRAHPAPRPLRRRGRALHRDDLRRAGAARPRRSGPGADGRQPVLRRRGGPAAGQRGQAHRRRKRRRAPDPAGRARGGRAPPRPAQREDERGAAGRRGDRPGLRGGAGLRGWPSSEPERADERRPGGDRGAAGHRPRRRALLVRPRAGPRHALRGAQPAEALGAPRARRPGDRGGLRRRRRRAPR